MPGDGPGWPTQATYTVKAGDTLVGIGEAHGTPWRDLARFNNLDNRDLIKPGDVLNLPWLEFVVSPGDYLVRIAIEHGRGATWQTLAYYNGLENDPDLIHPGDVVKIPLMAWLR
jgi:nucleoid-associated protein YgaU